MWALSLQQFTTIYEHKTNQYWIHIPSWEFKSRSVPALKAGMEADSSSEEDEYNDESLSVGDVYRVKIDLFTQPGGPKFHPNYLMSEWEEPTISSKKISVSIWLLSGVNPEEYNLQVSGCGIILHFNVALSQVMTGTIILHKFWLSEVESQRGMKTYNPKLSGL